jgi:hypothetical protein
MYQRSSGGRYLEILLFTLSSLLLYHTIIGFVLFLVPLQVMASRRGVRSLLAGVGVFYLVFIAIRFWPFIASRGESLPDMLILMEIGGVGFLLLGLVGVNIPFKKRPRTIVMLIAATAFAGVVGFPALLVLTRTEAFQQAMNNLFADTARILSAALAPAADGIGSSLLAPLLQPARLREIFQAFLARSLLADYMVLLTFSWWAGQAAAARAPAFFGIQPSFRFVRFRLESWWLWPLIASGALVLADLFFGISSWAFVGWNIGLVLLFLYGVQGMAIIWFLFDKYHLPRILWLLLVAGLLILAVSPGIGAIILVVVPILGISENWIRYRIPRDTAPPNAG